jgi:hypothetical protein
VENIYIDRKKRLAIRNQVLYICKTQVINIKPPRSVEGRIEIRCQEK